MIARFHLIRPLVVIVAGLSLLFLSTSPHAAEAPEPAREDAIRRKLMTFIIPRLEFREASIREAIDFLKQKSIQVDPDPDPGNRGVSIVLRLPVNQPAGVPAPPAVDPDGPRITLSLSNIPLWEALRYVGEMAHLKLTVRAYALELAPEERAPANVKKAPPAGPDALSPAAKATAAKLEKLVVPKVEFRGAPLEDAVTYLRMRAAGLDLAEPDPKKRGVNIVYVPPLPSAHATPPPPLSIALTNTPLGEVLRLIADSAKVDLAVEEYAVVLRARAAQP
jgi:hypothetical protein